MIDLKFAFRSMIDRSGLDRSDWSFSRIVWPLVSTLGNTDIQLKESQSPHPCGICSLSNQ